MLVLFVLSYLAHGQRHFTLFKDGFFIFVHVNQTAFRLNRRLLRCMLIRSYAASHPTTAKYGNLLLLLFATVQGWGSTFQMVKFTIDTAWLVHDEQVDVSCLLAYQITLSRVIVVVGVGHIHWANHVRGCNHAHWVSLSRLVMSVNSELLFDLSVVHKLGFAIDVFDSAILRSRVKLHS